MLKDRNEVALSGKIFWSKLDERGSYTMLRLGLDVGEGSYNRVFAVISNPHEKAYQFVKNDNQVVLLGAWLDTWVKSEDDYELQIKGYDSNCQFYSPEVVVPHLNEVFLYGKVKEFKDGVAILDCIGGRNPKTGEYSHRMVPVEIGDDLGDVSESKLMIRGSLGAEQLEGGKSKLRVLVDYDKINIMR